jgi:hypothetical protein
MLRSALTWILARETLPAGQTEVEREHHRARGHHRHSRFTVWTDRFRIALIALVAQRHTAETTGDERANQNRVRPSDQEQLRSGMTDVTAAVTASISRSGETGLRAAHPLALSGLVDRRQ